MMELKNKNVAIVGLRKSGLGAALLLKELGALPRVTDNNKNAETEENARELSKNNIQFELGTHTQPFIDQVELVVTSPGVSSDSPPLRWAEEKRIPIIGEMELAYSICKAPVIAITGTNGKSTVTTLTGEILKNSGKNVIVCGNIGTPFSSKVLELDSDGVFVLEISSFQLETIKSFRPKTSCLLNVTQNHLDRYGDMEQYFEAKKRIFLNQDRNDYAILNFDSQKIRSIGKAIKPASFYFARYRLPTGYDGAYVDNSELLIRHGRKFQWVANQEDVNLEGQHNLLNCLASVLMAYTFGVNTETMRQTLSNFKSLPHRFETVDIIKGVKFIDDSKATSVDSVIKALDCCKSPVILIAGGRDKGSDYRVLEKVIKEKVKYLILLGEARQMIADATGKFKPFHFVENMQEAVEKAFNLSSRGDTVLLSPLCSSFDMFKDYKERGEVFKKAIYDLQSAVGAAKKPKEAQQRMSADIK